MVLINYLSINVGYYMLYIIFKRYFICVEFLCLYYVIVIFGYICIDIYFRINYFSWNCLC